MYVPDSTLWLSILISAILFTFFAFTIPLRVPKGGFAGGKIALAARIFFFTFVAGIFWLALGLEATTLNNCIGAVCYSNPLTGTIGAIADNPASFWLPPLFYAIGVVIILIGAIIAIFGSLTGMRDFGNTDAESPSRR